MAETGAQFWPALSKLNGPGLTEHSAKLSNGHLSEGRVLVSYPREALLPGVRRQLSEICTSLGAELSALAPILEWQGHASSIHFGLEPEKHIVKCYLEFDPLEAPEPGLVFLALKWNREQAAINWYRSKTDRSPAEKTKAITDTIPGGASRELAIACLEQAGAEEPAVLLEVTEENSQRRSFDINLADCTLTLNDMSKQICDIFSEQDRDANPFLDRCGEMNFGHYAVGTGRDGKPFSTFYFGAKKL